MIVEKSELEDFKAILMKHGLSEGDFERSSRDDPLPGGGVWPERGSVTVKYKKTGAERAYSAGYGSAWVVEFENDLIAERFS